MAGGYSGEYDISIQSAETICQHLDNESYTVYKIIISKDKWYEEQTGEEVDKNDFTITIDHQRISFDLVFIGIHGTPGEDGKLQGYLDMLGIPYTSCNAVVSALTFNKVFCNRVVSHSGVPVANSMQLFQHRAYTREEILQELSMPLFVKPAEGGSSLATFKVKEAAELMPAITEAFRVSSQVMVEEFIAGRELTQGVFIKAGQVVTLPITEIVSKKEFFDYEAKYTPGITDELTPAPISENLAVRISNYSKKLYEDLGCRGITRFDYIYDEAQDTIFFLEVNTMPGQSPASIVPQQVRAMGGTLREFYDILIKESFHNT